MKSEIDFISKGQVPLIVFQINETYLLGIFQGSISTYDLLLKYKQWDKKTKKWSRARTPKHIHWTVDILIKMSHEPELTKDFLSFLLEMWNKTNPNKSATERNKALDIDKILKDHQAELAKYATLNTKGEYSIKFLIVIAKLLMQQEKNNLNSAYFFKNLLVALQEGKDIYKMVSISTHRGR